MRDLLAGPYPSVPADLGPSATALGARRARRRLRVRRAVALTAIAVAVAAAIWLGITQPWVPEPVDTTPRW
ncbi:hypothetical protein [Streptomyces sp. NPDC060194]|uniref:hypothetical protein n=1 Tax=Streptomyces sp. NPDC060194 TaxID=3347069 RepID=UPI00365D23DE